MKRESRLRGLEPHPEASIGPASAPIGSTSARVVIIRAALPRAPFVGREGRKFARDARAQGANRLSAIYTPALEPAILWLRALDSRTDIFGCRFSIQAATALPFS